MSVQRRFPDIADILARKTRGRQDKAWYYRQAGRLFDQQEAVNHGMDEYGRTRTRLRITPASSSGA
jgi:hypothetical protein